MSNYEVLIDLLINEDVYEKEVFGIFLSIRQGTRRLRKSRCEKIQSTKYVMAHNFFWFF